MKLTEKKSDLKQGSLHETWFHIIIILYSKCTDSKFGVLNYWLKTLAKEIGKMKDQ